MSNWWFDKDLFFLEGRIRTRILIIRVRNTKQNTFLQHIQLFPDEPSVSTSWI